MPNNITTLDPVSSPEKLKEQLRLAALPQGAFVRFGISDKNVIVSPFELPRMPVRKLRERLLLDSVELLSLPADQISMDFQVTKTTPQDFQGLFCCAPKALVHRYLQAARQQKITAVAVTADDLVYLELFFINKPKVNERSCWLRLSGSTVLLAVVNGSQVEMLRKINFETDDEAKLEIVQSLRSACAKSVRKDFDRIYYEGEAPLDNDILRAAQAAFDTSVQPLKVLPALDGPGALPEIFSINLIREEIFSPAQIKSITKVLNVIIVVIFACNLFFIKKIFDHRGLMSRLSAPAGQEMAKSDGINLSAQN